jgi:predicted RNA-binding protein with PIN domain
MKTVKSFSYKEYGVIMVIEPDGFYRVITTNSRSLETGVRCTFSKASETFDKFVESVLAEEPKYAPV